MAYGVTEDGFVIKPLTVIQSELEDDFRATFGEDINLAATSVFGQLIGILADRIYDTWEMAQATYSAYYPDSAEGVSLDNICALTGTVREPATYSEVTATVVGTAGTVLPSGRVFSTVTLGDRFATSASCTLVEATAWAGATAYVEGDVRKNASRTYVCITAGTSAGSGGPTTTSTDITDGTAHWRYLGEGTAYAEVACVAEELGEVQCPAYNLTTIETPASGLNNVTNQEDAALGSDGETDAALRVRREEELRAQGNSTVDSIRADVLLVDGVESCTVFENTTMVTDADGVPAKAIEVLVYQTGGGTSADSDIREAIWNSKPAGIETHGGVSGTVTDSQGTSHTVEFSRPTEKTVYITVDVTTDSDEFPLDGADQIKAALAEYGDENHGVGDDVIRSALFNPIFDISGVLDVTNIKLGFTVGPVGTSNLTIAARELATFDTARIVVNVT
jgi:uncharacterized phage protein gp47/JayE